MANSQNPQLMTLSAVIEELSLTPQQGTWLGQSAVIGNGFPIHYDGDQLQADPEEVAKWLYDQGLGHWLVGTDYEMTDDEEEEDDEEHHPDDKVLEKNSRNNRGRRRR